MIVTMYGLKSCDTVRKARAHLDGKGVAYAFHDFKAAGVTPILLKHWIDELGWEVLLNKAGTTFRALPDEKKHNLDRSKAEALMLAQPSMIKRPVLDLGSRRLVGFKPAEYDAIVV